MLQPVNCDGTGKTVNLIKLMNHNSILHEGCSCKTLLHSLRERRLNWVELVSWLGIGRAKPGEIRALTAGGGEKVMQAESVAITKVIVGEWDISDSGRLVSVDSSLSGCFKNHKI